MTSYKHNQDVLELKEEEPILLQDDIQQTSDVLTPTEATQIYADEREVIRNFHQEDERGSVLLRIIFTMTSEVKLLKITDHQNLKYDRSCGEHLRIFLGIKRTCNRISGNRRT